MWSLIIRIIKKEVKLNELCWKIKKYQMKN